LQATTKHLHFKDAALASQELAAAEEVGKTTVMMFTLLQEQHKAQLELMASANNLPMDTMFEYMNAHRGQQQGGGQDYFTTRQQQHRQRTQHHVPHEKEMHKLRKIHFSHARKLL
jgi:hypothetical protein